MSIFIITISLIVLVYISFIIKISKVSIPLVAIYIFFIFNYLINGVNPPKKEVDPNSINNTNIFNQKNIINDNNFYKKNVEPMPLVIPKIDPKKKKKSINPKKEVKNKIETKNKLPPKPYVTTLTMRDMQICRNVKNRNPIGTDTYFENTVDSLFCYTRVQNTGGKQELTHIWFFEDQKIGTVRYNIKTSNIYRSWTRKTILPHQSGTWRVEVQDTAGVVIGSEFFYITNSNNQ